MAPLQITQLMAIADMGTLYFSAKPFISVRSGSICSHVKFPPNLYTSAQTLPGVAWTYFRFFGGGLAALYFPVSLPIANGESFDQRRNLLS